MSGNVKSPKKREGAEEIITFNQGVAGSSPAWLTKESHNHGIHSGLINRPELYGIATGQKNQYQGLGSTDSNKKANRKNSFNY
jgi:hypothetical protein